MTITSNIKKQLNARIDNNIMYDFEEMQNILINIYNDSYSDKKNIIEITNDPQTDKIKEICESLIGCKINIGFTLTLQNGETLSDDIHNCNIIGDCMEDIVYSLIKRKIHTFEKGPKQASPDFYNTNEWEWELKCFGNSPCFDISNFNSYISQLEDNLEKKLYKTQYLIFKYDLNENIIKITDFKLCNVWEIIGYTGKYPITLQCKKGIWYNIRPCSFNEMHKSSKKTPLVFIQKICEAIAQSPNILPFKQNTIEKIYQQYYKIQYSKIIKIFNKQSESNIE